MFRPLYVEFKNGYTEVGNETTYALCCFRYHFNDLTEWHVNHYYDSKFILTQLFIDDQLVQVYDLKIIDTNRFVASFSEPVSGYINVMIYAPSNVCLPVQTPGNSATPTPTQTTTPTQTPTNTPTQTPTATVTPTVTPTVSVTASVTPTVTRTGTPFVSVTPTASPTAGVTPTPTSTPTPTATHTPTLSVTPTHTPTPTPSPTVTPTHSVTPSITPSVTPSPTVTPTHNVTPSVTPTVTPSGGPVFATLNPSQTNASITLSNGNLTATKNTNDGIKAISKSTVFMSSSLKYYWESTGTYISGTETAESGIADAIESLTTQGLGRTGHSAGGPYFGDGKCTYGNTYILNLGTITSGSFVGHRFDGTTGTYEVSLDGSTWNQVFTGLTGSWTPGIDVSSMTSSITVNFGATPFHFAVPGGYRAGVY